MNFRLNYPQHAPYLFAFGIALLCLPIWLQWQQTKDWMEYSIVARAFGTIEAEEMTFVSENPRLFHNWGAMGGGGEDRHTYGSKRFSPDGKRPLLRSAVVSWRANGQIIEVPMALAPPSPQMIESVRNKGTWLNETFFKNTLTLILEVDADHQRAWGYWHEEFIGGPDYRHADPREDEWWPARRVQPIPAPIPHQKDPAEVEFLKETP